MATDKAPTKAEFLEALKKNGINNLEDLVDALLPETGGYSDTIGAVEVGGLSARVTGPPHGWALDVGTRIGQLYGSPYG